MAEGYRHPGNATGFFWSLRGSREPDFIVKQICDSNRLLRILRKSPCKNS